MPFKLSFPLEFPITKHILIHNSPLSSFKIASVQKENVETGKCSFHRRNGSKIQEVGLINVHCNTQNERTLVWREVFVVLPVFVFWYTVNLFSFIGDEDHLSYLKIYSWTYVTHVTLSYCLLLTYIRDWCNVRVFVFCNYFSEQLFIIENY